MTEKSFSQILTTFPSPNTIVASLEKANLKTGPDDSILYPKHTHTFRGAVLIVFR